MKTSYTPKNTIVLCVLLICFVPLQVLLGQSTSDKIDQEILEYRNALSQEKSVSSRSMTGITGTPNSNASDLINNVFIDEDCIVANILATDIGTNAVGEFSNGTSSIGFDGGIVLSTGFVQDVMGPNDNNAFSSITGGGTSDPDLQDIVPGQALFDVASITFEFEPLEDEIFWTYVFASEEYCEFTGGTFNDVFGFFIDGPVPPAQGGGSYNNLNLAALPGGVIVSVNSINSQTNSQYYTSNLDPGQPGGQGSCAGDNASSAAAPNDIQFDGFTVELQTRELFVIPCETYTIKLAIADGGDANVNSAVFIKEGSFFAGSSTSVEIDVDYSHPDEVAIEGCFDACYTFCRSSSSDPNLEYEIDLMVNPASTATAGIDYNAADIISPIIIPIGTECVDMCVPMIVGEDGEPAEQLILDIESDCQCSDFIPYEMDIIDPEPITITIADEFSICPGESQLLDPIVVGGVPNLTYNWSTSESSTSITVSPTASQTYTLEITDDCGQSQMVSIDVVVEDIFTGVLSGDAIVCSEGTSNNSTIQIAFSGGDPGPWDFTFEYNGVSTTYFGANSNPFDFNAVLPGTYTLTGVSLSGGAGCVGMGTGTVVVSEVDVNLTADPVDILCNGAMNGSIMTNISGQTDPVNYQWIAGSSATTPDLMGLSAGQYTLMVTDANDCEATLNVEVSEYDPIQITGSTIISPTCDDINSGEIQIDVFGGSGSYNFNWSDNSLNEDLTGVSAGFYEVVVSDATVVNCEIMQPFVIDPPPIVDIMNADNVSCDENGTPGDNSDDIITFALDLSSLDNSFNFTATVDQGTINPTSGAFGGVVLFTLQTGSAGGGNVFVTISNSDDPTCFSIIEIVDPGACSGQPCNLSDIGLSGAMCDQNGTPLDGADDILVFNLNPSGTNLGSGYNVTVSTGTIMPTSATYGMSQGFTMQAGSATGGDITVTITDIDDPTCTIDILIPEVGSCEDAPCDISNAVITNVLCNTGGDPEDVSDDFISFTLNATADNASTSYTVSVSNGAITPATGTYGSDDSFNLQAGSAGGGDITLTITDSMDPNCTISVVIADPGDCSAVGCLITSAQLQDVDCDNNMTDIDGTDDVIVFTLNPTGNALGTNYSVSANMGTVTPATGVYGAITMFSMQAGSAGGGDVTITITDDNDNSCTIDVLVADPGNCAVMPCDITTTLVDEIACNNNMTEADGTDDFITFQLLIDGTNTSGTYTLTPTMGTVTPNTGTFGTLGNFSMQTGSAGAGDFMIRITDATDMTCSVLITIIDPGNCPGAICNINSEQLLSVGCDQGTTPFDGSDDAITFSIDPVGINLGSSYTISANPGTVTPTTANYGTSTMFNMQPGSAGGGDVTITLTDSADSNCEIQFVISDPGDCADMQPCSINSAGLTDVDCNSGPDTDIISDDFITFNLNPIGISLGATYSVSVSSGSINPTTGTYGSASSFSLQAGSAGGGGVTLTITDASGVACSFTINVIDPGPCDVECLQVVDAGANANINCGSPTSLLSGTTSEAGTITWFDPQGNAISSSLDVQVDEVGIYTLQVVYADGCIETDVAEVFGDFTEPVSDAGLDMTLNCYNNSMLNLDGSGSSAGTQIAYSWIAPNGSTIGSSTNQDVNILGTYTLIVTDQQNGCSSEDMVVITEDVDVPNSDIIPFAGNTTIDCINSSVNLSVLNPQDVNYSWTTLEGNFTSDNIDVTSAGAVSLDVIDVSSGCSSSSVINITDISDLPNVDIVTPDVIGCDNTTVIIDGSMSDSGPEFTYQWLDSGMQAISGANSATLEVNAGGIYFLQVINQDNLCETIEQTEVIEGETMHESSISANSLSSNSYQLQINTTSNIVGVEWEANSSLSCTSCENPIADIDTLTTFFVLIDHGLGCTSRAQITLIPRIIEDIYVPTIFSPNNDGQNDFFFIGSGEGVVLNINSLLIFDRWGNLMFQKNNFSANDPSEGWDGSYNNKAVQPGVYVYQLSVETPTDNNKIITGELTLIN